MRPSGLTIPKLPPGKTPVRVIADFLAYLFQCAKDYIQQTHASGESLWNSVQGHIDVVLSHPNGWEVSQHVKMREAAILAGLIPGDTAGRARLHFVTEGEASLHYCVNSGLASEAIQVRPLGLTILEMLRVISGRLECDDRRLRRWNSRLDNIQVCDCGSHSSGRNCCAGL